MSFRLPSYTIHFVPDPSTMMTLCGQSYMHLKAFHHSTVKINAFLNDPAYTRCPDCENHPDIGIYMLQGLDEPDVVLIKRGTGHTGPR